MTELVIVYWRDIPAQIIIGRGRKAVKRPLSERFEKAIDRAAMKSGMAGTDDYLSEWRKAEPVHVDGEAENVANEWVAKLESEYSDEKLRVLIDNDGREA